MPKVSQLPLLNTISTTTEILLVDSLNTKKIRYSHFFDQLRVELSDVGVPGPQGNQGDQGVQGASGIGVQGAAGVQGAQGPADGFQGHQGNQGYQGSKGIQGSQGHQGIGIQGHQGYQGLRGVQGASNGPQGAQGIQGAQGTKGDFGGPQGGVGAQGTQGHQGVQGGKGNPGVQGAQGIQGTQGAGYQGVQGDFGIQGHQGNNGSGVPTGGTQGQVLAKASNANNDVEWKDTAAIGLGVRQAFTTSTAVIANNNTGTIQVLGYSTYILSKVETTAPAWVRIYSDTTSRTNDASRSEDTDPLPGVGVIAEVITTSSKLTQLITPGVVGFNSTSSDSNVYLSVKNKSGSAQSIGVTITLLKLEQ